MQIQINKDFQEYKEDFWRGFSLKELLSIGIATGTCAGFIFLLYQFLHIPLTGAVYLSVPVAIPILMTGFYRYQGMTLAELIRERIWQARTEILAYEAGEMGLSLSKEAKGDDTGKRPKTKERVRMIYGADEQ